jgi:sigma-B regulation protein RsbU (phosphoserine phosphatase)
VTVLRTLAEAASGEVGLRAAAERSASLARTLQAALLPPITPDVPGLDVGAAYRAAGAGTEVVGDFYDVFESAGGRWNAVLGDVCGKGVPAARLTGLARYTLRAGAMREQRPSRVLGLLNEALSMADTGDDRFVTAVLVVLDRDADGFGATLSSAGHVPAIVRDATGCRALDVRGSLLGVLDTVTLTDFELRLAAGDVIVLCTDGVTEARDATGEQFGSDRLLGVVGAATGSAATIAAAVDDAVVAFAGPRAQDDVAILVLRVR